MTAPTAPTARSQPVRVNLLPKEFSQSQSASARRRLAVLLVLLVIVAVAAGLAFAALHASTGSSALLEQQDREQVLLLEKAQYGEGEKLQLQVDSTVAAKAYGASIDLDWAALTRDIIAKTPAGIEPIAFDGTSSTISFEQNVPSGPLEALRVARVQVVGSTTDPRLVDAWAAKLATIEGYLAQSVATVQNESGIYQVVMIVDFDEGALRHRFGSPDDDAPQADDQEG